MDPGSKVVAVTNFEAAAAAEIERPERAMKRYNPCGQFVSTEEKFGGCG
jgi:hypothetical protein